MHSNEALGSEASEELPGDLQRQHQRSDQLTPVCNPERGV